MNKDNQINFNHIAYVLLSVIIFVFPFSFLAFTIGEDVTNFFPAFSDEIINLHQAITFSSVGFSGGYYTVDEMAASFSFSHFFSHGISYPLIYGTLINIFNTDHYVAIVINSFFYCASFIIVCYLVKLEVKQSLTLFLIYVTFWPAQIYMMTSMRLVFFCAIYVIISGMLYYYYSKEKPRPLHIFVLLIIVSFSIVAKITSIIFILPIIYLALKTSPKLILAFIVTLVCIYSAYFSLATSAPFPNFFSSVLTHLVESPSHAISLIINNSRANVIAFFELDENPLLIGMRIAILSLLIFSIFISTTQEEHRNLGVLISLNLIFILSLTILLYDIEDWRDYRLFAPVLLFCLSLLVICKCYKPIFAYLILNILLIGNFIHDYSTWIPYRFPSQETLTQLEGYKNQLGSNLEYDETGDGWDNTILVSLNIATSREVLGIPAGFGISTFFDVKSLNPKAIKSRYLFLNQSDYLYLAQSLHLVELDMLDSGNLYINANVGDE
ncbi:hypothetical protein L1D24_18000 [Vibrio brasiliensis]|uniref:hypothetical protein n=1 Tax=Vibrio brasiliensis TaxID=170652 RepID=UPI001EFDC62F|nr:hypothetical protein [Vibrio brasiliensis]MCG9650445.1 hypothetical protein [Vibrio brasiliensis]